MRRCRLIVALAMALSVVACSSKKQADLLRSAEAYASSGDFTTAEKLCNTALSKATQKKDTLAMVRALEEYAALYLRKPDKDPARAINMLGRVGVELKTPLSPSDKAYLAYAYSLVNMPEESLVWQKAAALATDSQNRQMLRAEDKMQASKLRRLLAAVFVVVLFIIAANYARLRRIESDKLLQEEKAESDRLMALAEDLQSRLQSKSSKDMEVLERLCEQYYVYEGTENLQPKILKEVTSLVKGLRENTKDLEDSLNRDHNSLMKRFRSQMSTLKEDDIRLFTYLAAGFSSTTISALMEKDKQYVYNRIYRLKGRLTSSDAPDKEEFLSMISK